MRIVVCNRFALEFLYDHHLGNTVSSASFHIFPTCWVESVMTQNFPADSSSMFDFLQQFYGAKTKQCSANARQSLPQHDTA